jgi:streptogramin lyase
MVQEHWTTPAVARPGFKPRVLRKLGLGILAAATLTLAPAQSASAAPAGEFTMFDLGPAGEGANAIASGPDGNMWFTNNANNSIGRITPSGAVTYFAVPTTSASASTGGPGLFSIAAGPDGNMWFTEFFENIVGKITPAGVITTYPVPTANAMPMGITAGPDGNIWFVLDDASGIGRITPGGLITEFPIPTPGATGPATITSDNGCLMCGFEITAGPLESVWFTIPAANRVGRITMAGVVTTMPVTTAPPASTTGTNISIGAITAGDDGNLWITQNSDGKITRLTTDGVATAFALPSATSQPSSITPGPDGSLWIGNGTGNALSQFVVPGVKSTPVITQFTIPTAGAMPTSVAMGADGSAWFTSLVNPTPAPTTLQVGRLSTGVGPILTVKVSGTAKVGSALTCSYVSNHGGPPANARYQWLRGGKAIANQTAKKYTPRAGDVGAKVSCRAAVTYSGALNQLGATSKSVQVKG